ncbi:MAG: MFS transporter [Candidatus Sericytochromatia bacterium]|nr:MFS transporter [Candidatus Sericytochromatia bacterium]
MFSAQIQGVAVGWQVYQITKDPLSLGIIGLAEAIPSILVSLYAGHLADNANRKNIMQICLFLFLLCSLSLFLFTFDLTQQYIGFSVYHIYTIIFISGIARGFMSPASFGLLSQIVPRNLYTQSSLWSSTAFQFGLVSGPAIGGLLYGFAGAKATYLTDAILVFIAFICTCLIKKQETPKSQEQQSLFESISEGLNFVFKHQIILSAITLDLFAVLFGGAVALLPVFADQILHVGPKGLGIMRTAPAVGAILMSLIIAKKKKSNKDGRNLLLSVGGFGICMILFAISKNLYFSIFLLALSGAFDNVSVIIRSTIMQVMTPDNMRGRVSAVNSIFIGSSNEIGSFESGLAAKVMGTIPSVIFGGCMTMLVVLITSLKADKLRNLDLKKQIEQINN